MKGAYGIGFRVPEFGGFTAEPGVFDAEEGSALNLNLKP